MILIAFPTVDAIKKQWCPLRGYAVMWWAVEVEIKCSDKLSKSCKKKMLCNIPFADLQRKVTVSYNTIEYGLCEIVIQELQN